jgi:hypothetical protein
LKGKLATAKLSGFATPVVTGEGQWNRPFTQLNVHGTLFFSPTDISS